MAETGNLYAQIKPDEDEDKIKTTVSDVSPTLEKKVEEESKGSGLKIDIAKDASVEHVDYPDGYPLRFTQLEDSDKEARIAKTLSGMDTSNPNNPINYPNVPLNDNQKAIFKDLLEQGKYEEVAESKALLEYHHKYEEDRKKDRPLGGWMGFKFNSKEERDEFDAIIESMKDEPHEIRWSPEKYENHPYWKWMDKTGRLDSYLESRKEQAIKNSNREEYLKAYKEKKGGRTVLPSVIDGQDVATMPIEEIEEAIWREAKVGVAGLDIPEGFKLITYDLNKQFVEQHYNNPESWHLTYHPDEETQLEKAQENRLKRALKKENEYIVNVEPIFSINGFNSKTDYSVGNHIIMTEDYLGNEVEIKINSVPSQGNFLVEEHATRTPPGVIRSDDPNMIPVELGDPYGGDSAAHGYVKRGHTFYPNPNVNNVEGRKDDAPKYRIKDWDNLTQEAKDKYESDWSDAINRYDRLIDEYNDPSTTDLRKKYLLDEINKFQLVNQGDFGDGIWVPNFEDEMKLEMYDGFAQKSIEINGESFPPIWLRNEWSGVVIDNISEDGLTVTLRSAKDGSSRVHNIYDFINKQYTIDDMNDWYEATKNPLPQTFIYNDYMLQGQNFGFDSTYSDGEVVKTGFNVGEDFVGSYTGGYEEWVKKNIIMAATLREDKEHANDVNNRRNTSVEKGVLKWTRAEKMDDGTVVDIDIDSISEYAGVVLEETVDGNGNATWSFVRPSGWDGNPESFMITGHFDDGSTIEINNQELQKVMDIQKEIELLRKWAGRGVNVDSDSFISPYEYEERVQNVEAKIKALNVLFGDKNKTHITMLYSNLIDAYFDKSEDYQVVTPNGAYEIYKELESQGVDDPETTDVNEATSSFLMSKEEYFDYMGWDEETIKRGHFTPKELRNSNYSYEYIVTVADVKEHARFMRAVKFHSLAMGYNTIMEANKKWVNDKYGGDLTVVGDPATEEFTRRGHRYSEDIRDWSESEIGLYKEIIFNGTPKDKEAMWAMGGITYKEVAMLQAYDNQNFTFRDVLSSISDFATTPLTTTVHNWFADEDAKKTVRQLPLIQAYFNEHIIPYPKEVEEYWKNLEDKELMPINISKASPSTQQKVLKFFTSVGAATESMLTPANILMMFAGVGLLKKLKDVPKYGQMLQAAITTVFGTTMAMGAWKSIETAIEAFERGDDDAGYEALGNATIDTVFAVIGAKGAFKFGKQSLSRANTRIQDYKKNVAEAFELNAPFSHKSAKDIIRLGGEEFYVKDLLASDKGRVMLSKMLKDGQLPSELNLKNLILEYKAKKLSKLDKTELERIVAEAEAKAGRKLNSKEKRVIIEQARKDIRKKVYDEGIPDSELTPQLEALTSYNQVCRDLITEFMMSGKFPDKTNFGFQKFLDAKFELWKDNFAFKNWTSKDIAVFRRHIGNSLKGVKHNLEQGFKSKGDIIPWMADVKGEELTKVKGKVDAKYDYSGNIDLSRFPKELRPAIRKLGRFIGKEVNDNIRFRGKKWSEVDAEALKKETIENVLQKIANGDSYSTYSLTEFRTLSHIMEAQMRHYVNNYKTMSGKEQTDALELLKKVYNARTGTLSEAAHILNISKMKIDPSTDYMIRNYIGQKNKGAEILSKLHDTSVNTGLTTTYKLMAGLAEVGRNMKLMNLASVLRSTVGNTSHLFLTGAERPLAVFYDKLFTSLDRGFRGTAAWLTQTVGGEVKPWMKVNAKQSRFIVEELAFWNNYVRAYGGASINKGNNVYRNVWEIMKENPDVLKNDAFFIRERFDVKGIIPKAWGGTFLRGPQNIQAGLDILIRQPAELAFLHKYITRRVIQEGHKWGTKAYNKRYDEILNNPSKEDLRLAKQDSEYITFQSELKGFDAMINKLRTGSGHTAIGESVSRSAGNSWAQGFNAFFMPFFNTPMNIMKAIYQRTPLAAVFSNKAQTGIKKGINTGDWGMYSDVAAQVTSGSLLLYNTHHVMDKIFGGDYGDKWVVEGDWTDLSEEERNAKYAAGFKPNTIRYRDDDGFWVSTYMSGWEPFSSFLYAMGSMQEGHPESGMANDMLNAYKAIYKEYLNNPFMQGVGDLTDLANGETDLLGWALKTGKGMFVPNFMSQLQQINDPYYLMSPEYNEYIGSITDNRGQYTGSHDSHIFKEQLYKHMLGSITMGLDDKSAKSILENAKSVVSSEKEKYILRAIEEYGYSREVAEKYADEIPDLIYARPFFNDYAMNLPKQDIYGQPIDRPVGQNVLTHLSGIKQFSQKGMQPYWGMPDKYDQILTDEKYWAQIVNHVYEESMRLNLHDMDTNIKTLLGVGSMNRVDEWLINNEVGRYKFLNMIDNMVMVGTGEYDENGDEVFELNLDNNGNIKLSDDWANSSDIEKLQKVDHINKRSVNIVKRQIGSYLLEQQKQYYDNWDEVSLSLEKIFSPQNLFADLIGEAQSAGQEIHINDAALSRERIEGKAGEFEGASFKVFYKDKRYGEVSVMIGSEEINQAYTNWSHYYMLKNLKDEDGKLIFGDTYDKQEFDAWTNYEAIYREERDRYINEKYPNAEIKRYSE